MRITKTVSIKDNRKYGYYYEEAMKTLRTNIGLSGRNVKSILFTSSHPNEGKSELSFQIARQFGEAGKKVIYIDADIRKGSASRKMKLPAGMMGLPQYLSGQCEMDEIGYHTSMPNMDIIMSSVSAPNPTELFETQAFEDLIRDLEKDYDYVIIDTAPVGTVIDAAVIGQVCDGAVFVVSAKDTSYRMAQRSVEQLERSGCKILGAVLNMVDPKEAGVYSSKYGKYKKYGRYGKYGKYGRYGSSGTSAAPPNSGKTGK